MDYMSIDFAADRSSRLPFNARTNRQRQLNALPHSSGHTAGMGIVISCIYPRLYLPTPA